MVWTIARRELLANLLTLRLSVALVCVVVLSALTVLISSVDFSLRTEAYHKQVSDLDAELDGATVWSQVEPDVILPPQPLSILCPGAEKSHGSRYNVQLWNKAGGGGWDHGIVDSGWMKTLVQIDFTTVVAVVLSFLAIAIGYDAIAGERERGTLRQVLVNPVPRGVLLTGKLLGGCLSLWSPFAIAYLLALAIMASNPDVHLTSDDWVRLFGIFVLACLFLAQIFSFALTMSVFARSPSTSLILCLFGWLVGGVVYMNAMPSIVQHGVAEKPFQDFMAKNSDLWGRHWSAVGEWEEANPPPPPAYAQFHVSGGNVVRYGHPLYYDWRALQSRMIIESVLEHTDGSHQLLMENQEPLHNEAYWIDDWSILSPVTNFQVLTYMLATTTIRDKLVLRYEGMQYREAFFDHLRREGITGSWRWFTDDRPGQERLVPDPESVTDAMLQPGSDFLRQRQEWIQQQEEIAARSPRTLDLSGMPRFPGAGKHSLAESLQRMTPGLAVMLLTLGASLLAAMARFVRDDPA